MKKIILKIAFAIGSAFVTFIVFYIGGSILGNILHTPHEHHYECACDQDPVLTILEGCIFGAIYLVLFLLGLNYILCKIGFDKTERIIALILLFLLNLYICYQVGIILCTPPIC